MSAFIVFTRERIRSQADLDSYSSKAGATLAGHAAKPLAVYGACQTMEGAEVDGAVIVEFPSVEAARAWYDSPDYSEARLDRFRGADYRVFIVEGV